VCYPSFRLQVRGCRVNFLNELRQRNVIRVAGAYLVASWLVLQIINVITDAAGLPEWADGLVLIFLVAGLPVALIIAWAFELTPDGLRPTQTVSSDDSLRAQTASKMDIAILAGLIVVVALLIGRWAWPAPQSQIEIALDTASETRTGIMNAASVSEQSVAVLPFLAMSQNVNDGYFADGLTEEILNSLAILPQLLVTSRTSAFQFKGDNLPSTPEIASQLGVAHIVEGSVRRSGDQVRVTAQLIRASDDSHLWSQTYDRQMDDIFAIQDDIAANIAEALNVVLDEEQRARMRSAGVRNVDAFIAYQQATEPFQIAHSDGENKVDRLRLADPYFETATRLAPDFSQAYFWRGDYYFHILEDHGLGISPLTDEEQSSALETLTSLLQAAHETAEDPARRTYIEADQFFLSDDWSSANRLLDRAILVQNCSVDNYLYNLISMSARWDDFIPVYEHMVRCDPLDSIRWDRLAGLAVGSGRFDLALNASAEGLDVSSGYNEYFLWTTAFSLQSMGQFEEAEAFIAELAPSPHYQTYLRVNAAALDGDYDQARDLRATHNFDSGRDLELRMIMHAILGEREEANAIARQLDDQLLGYLHLSRSLADCVCGAPFDLEATPDYAARMQQAGFPWPPAEYIEYPLKDW